MATITGTEGDDLPLVGTDGDDIVNALGGNDNLIAGPGTDVYNAGEGNDLLWVHNVGDFLGDTFNGDAGEDLLVIGSGVTDGIGAAIPNMSGIEGIAFNPFNARTIQLTSGFFEQLGGHPVVRVGGGASNTLIIDVTSTAFDVSGFEFIGFWSEIGTVQLQATAGNTAPLTLTGSAFRDTLIGGTGADMLMGGSGADRLDGGAGVDTASYAPAAGGVVVFLGGGQFNQGDAVGDTFASVENLAGSGQADLLGGDGGVNSLSGNGGNDWLLGLGGNDTLQGGDGIDVLIGGLGADVLDGGAGTQDVASYREAAAGLTASLSAASANTGEAAGDSYAGVEQIWGSDFADVLTGQSGGGQVYGFAGDDVLTGLEGNDVFYGGIGADTLTTGAGVDDLFYLRWDGAAAEGGDTLTDFAAGVDHLTVSRYWFGFGDIAGPAAALTSAHADFLAAGASATALRPTFFWNATTGRLDFDPDGIGADAAVHLATLSTGTALSLADIWSA